jgi:large subunit ribosomal protein L17
MRHQIKAKHLNRDSNSRKALFKGLVTSLITSGEIHTTEPKAKVIKGLVDKLIHRAQEGSVNTRRVLARFFGRRDVVNELVDKVAPAMKDRSSGFTRIVRLGKRRGDNTMLVKMELVNNPHEEVKAVKKADKKDEKSSTATTETTKKGEK